MPTYLTAKEESHPHALELKNSKVPFICDGCKQLGFGVCYQCPRSSCDYVLHEIGGRQVPSLHLRFLKKDLHFRRSNKEVPYCDVCTLEVTGFVYQCSRDDHHAHPCCTNLRPDFSLPDTDMKIYLRKKWKPKCLKCLGKRRSSSAKGWAYVSSDGSFCYHVACMKEAWLENWKRGYFQLDKVDDDDGEKLKILALQNLAPKEVVHGGRTSKAMKGIKWLITFLRLVVSAVIGDPVDLIFNLVQISHKF